MKVVGWLFSVFAILAHLALGLFLGGVGLIGLLESKDLHFPLVPGVAPESMAAVLAGLGALAVLSVVVALRRSRSGRFLFVLWNLFAAGLLVCAFLRPEYRFEGEEHFRQGLYVFLGSLIALWGSISHFRRARRAETA